MSSEKVKAATKVSWGKEADRRMLEVVPWVPDAWRVLVNEFPGRSSKEVYVRWREVHSEKQRRLAEERFGGTAWKYWTWEPEEEERLVSALKELQAWRRENEAKRLGSKKTVTTKETEKEAEKETEKEKENAKEQGEIPLHGGHWLCVAERVGNGRTYEACRQRFQLHLTPGARSGPWSEDELKQLHAAVKECGKLWLEVARRVGTRTRRQCALKWHEIRRKAEAKGLRAREDMKGKRVKAEEDSDMREAVQEVIETEKASEYDV